MHAPNRNQNFYPGVTQVCSLGFSHIRYDYMGEIPYLLSQFLDCLLN